MSTLKVDTILKRSGTGTITLGQSGDTLAIPAGATIANSGTATGFAPVGISSSMTSGTGLSIDADGHVTQPLQSTFMTQQTGALTVANTHTLFSTNTTERWDVNSDLSGATFTAPVTGKYVLSVNVLWESVSSDTVFEARITTSNRNYSMWRNNRDYAGGGTTYVYNGACVIADMDASDTAHVVHIGPTATVHVSGAWSWFSGYLLG